MEEWKPVDWIPGIPTDKYQISSEGRLRNMYWEGTRDSLIVPLTRQYETGYVIAQISDRIHTPGRRRKGLKPPLLKSLWISKAVARAFIPTPYGIDPDGLNVFHLNDDITDNHVENLEWRIGNSQKTMFRIDDRKRVLEIIAENYMLSSIKISGIIRKELGIKMHPGTIQALLCHKPDGTMKSKQYKLLGVDTSEMESKYKPFKLPNDIVDKVCIALCAYNGDVKLAFEDLQNNEVPVVTQGDVKRILEKRSYCYLSDSYFDYDPWTKEFRSRIK